MTSSACTASTRNSYLHIIGGNFRKSKPIPRKFHGSLMMPTMQTDIMLEYGDKTLIIDTKYYSRTTQQRYGIHTLHSGNLYQIFTYVKNKEAELAKVPHTVSGMLLYAKTDEEISPNRDYSMSGNKISVRTLDLNQDFSAIRIQLDRIVIDHFE